MPESATSIDRESKLPFYFQLYEILRAKIIAGQWKPGDMIPPESELIELYKVSRITARQALDALVRDGLIFRQRGKGSFVSHPTIEQGLTRIITFTQDMQQRGFTPQTQVIDSRLVPAPKYIASQLGIREGEELVYLERLRLADNEPMCVEESYLVHQYCRNILSQDIQSKSLRDDGSLRSGFHEKSRDGQRLHTQLQGRGDGEYRSRCDRGQDSQEKSRAGRGSLHSFIG